MRTLLLPVSDLLPLLPHLTAQQFMHLISYLLAPLAVWFMVCGPALRNCQPLPPRPCLTVSACLPPA